MSDQNVVPPTDSSNRQSPLRLIILIVGMGILGVLFAFLLFEGGNDQPAVNENEAEAVTDVSVSDFPVVDPEVSQPIDESSVLSVAVGHSAPNFTLTDFEGNRVQLSDLAGRPVIVNFWASWCAPCRVEMPHLQDAAHNYADDNLEILAINFQESPEIATQFFEEEGLTFTGLLDVNGEVAEAYGVFNMPTTYFINADGEVTVVHRGPMTLSQIDGYLELTLQ